MPTFYAPTQPNPMVGTLSMMTISIAGVLFGALHFIGWNISTPTKIERDVWRFFTVAITLTFFATLLNTLVLVYKLSRQTGYTQSSVSNPAKIPFPIRVLEVLFGALQLSTVPFYIVGRVCLFGLAFATLRNLPMDARKEIVWTSYIPHI